EIAAPEPREREQAVARRMIRPLECRLLVRIARELEALARLDPLEALAGESTEVRTRGEVVDERAVRARRLGRLIVRLVRFAERDEREYVTRRIVVPRERRLERAGGVLRFDTIHHRLELAGVGIDRVGGPVACRIRLARTRRSGREVDRESDRHRAAF